uniref:Phosphatidylinositol-specific phospholipase C X domain-containing protein n=1 Tax=Arion vulgaris TaxID=1028688 RepID=A0A0B7A4R3_9EUPU
MTSHVKTLDEHNCEGELKENIETESWMSSLPASLHHLPISKLAIPGTHDSGTFSLSKTLSPDADEHLKCLSKFPLVGPIIGSIICNWAQCQKLDFTQQLYAGIRYFDLRVATRTGSEDFFLVHTVFGPKISDLVEAVLMFLEAHSHEVVLLDLNHFYAMEMKDHELLMEYLISKFGSKICNRCYDISELTLHNLWNHRKQVIIFYQSQAARGIKEFWPAHSIVSPWPNTDQPKACIEYLNQCFSTSHTRNFKVCQGVLTPTLETIIKGLYHHGNVKTLSETLLPLLCPWIQHDHACPLTIVIADFTDKGDLIQEILALNYKRAVSV